jgi:hypothetical protein
MVSKIYTPCGMCLCKRNGRADKRKKNTSHAQHRASHARPLIIFWHNKNCLLFTVFFGSTDPFHIFLPDSLQPLVLAHPNFKLYYRICVSECMRRFWIQCDHPKKRHPKITPKIGFFVAWDAAERRLMSPIYSGRLCNEMYVFCLKTEFWNRGYGAFRF